MELTAPGLVLAELVGLAAASAPGVVGTRAVAAGTGGLAAVGEFAAGVPVRVAVDCAGANEVAGQNISNAAKPGPKPDPKTDTPASARRLTPRTLPTIDVTRDSERNQCIVPLYARLDASEHSGESLA